MLDEGRECDREGAMNILCEVYRSSLVVKQQVQLAVFISVKPKSRFPGNLSIIVFLFLAQ